jgi:hypothetical protein
MGKTGRSERKMNQMKKEDDFASLQRVLSHTNQMKKKDAFASLRLSITRAGTTYLSPTSRKKTFRKCRIWRDQFGVPPSR